MLLKLTKIKTLEPVIVGTESIIDVKPFVLKSFVGSREEITHCTKVQSRGAMVETSYVEESVEEIWSQYQSLTSKTNSYEHF